ncbi:MAG: FtsX-like permease family protein [Frankiaceae bacterium]
MYAVDDGYRNTTMHIVRVVHGDAGPSLVPPGISHLPALGEYYASPALERLLSAQRRAGADPTILLDRFPDHLVGTISPSGLLDPSELAAYVGGPPPARGLGRALQGWGGPSERQATDTVTHAGFLVIALALFLPILALAALAGRAGTAARIRRHTALHLVGYSRRELLASTVAEVLLTVGGGAVLGLGLEAALNRALHDARWLPWHWWPSSFAPTMPQLLIAVVGVVAVATASGLLSVRGEAYRRITTAPRSSILTGRPRTWRLIPLVLTLIALFGVPHTPRHSTVLLVIAVAMIGAIALAVAPVCHFFATRSAARAETFEQLYSARRAQRTSVLGARSTGTLATGLFMAIVAVMFLQHFDLANTVEERIVAANWPSDTVRATEALHGNDIDRISQAAGVKDPFVLRLLQGPTADGSAYITAAFVDCSALMRYVSTREFPGCDRGQALDVAPRDSLSPVDPTTVRHVALGTTEFGAAVLSKGVAVAMPVRLHAKSIRRSDALSRMFSDIGVTILIGGGDTPRQALAKALTPEMYFRSADGGQSIDRVRTYFANKYGNGAIVQTFAQRLAAKRTDAIVYWRALWVAVGFALALSTATFGAATLEDLRRRRTVSAALVAAGVPENVLSRATVASAALALIPGTILAGAGGAYTGHVLLAAVRASTGTPYMIIALLTVLTTGVALLIVGILGVLFGRIGQARPSAIAPE